MKDIKIVIKVLGKEEEIQYIPDDGRPATYLLRPIVNKYLTATILGLAEVTCTITYDRGAVDVFVLDEFDSVNWRPLV